MSKKTINLDHYSIPDIKKMIKDGEISESYPVWFYNNEGWDGEEETEYDEYYVSSTSKCTPHEEE